MSTLRSANPYAAALNYPASKSLEHRWWSLKLHCVSAPYLCKDATQSDCVFENHVQNIFGPILEAKGLMLLSYLEVGDATVFCKQPITPAEVPET